MFQDITIEDLLALRQKNDLITIDVRSPSEFREATIPGSVNIPLFTDEERAEVGTIYKQVSSQAAKKRGLQIVSAKLPDFVRQFAELEGRKAVFCWRGGMRSKTTATLLDLMDIHTVRLEGGVRAYRKWVVDTLENIHFRPEAVILNGYTGIGKTIILHKLEKLGYPVLDLEGMAGHRGSIFGQVGLIPNNQKKFEAQLVEKLLKLKDVPFVLFEAESKRIGRVTLPQFLIEKKFNGRQIFIHLPIEERIKHILEDYRPEEHHEECLEAFRKIKSRIHTPIASQIDDDLTNGRYAEGVRLLLEHYYDARYSHTAEDYRKDRITHIQAANTDEAAEKILTILQNAYPQYKADTADLNG